MKNIIYFLSILFTFNLSIAYASTTTESTNRYFHGDWEGQSNSTDKCGFSAWKATFLDDGIYVVSFFTNEEKNISKEQEVGAWWTEENKLFMLALGAVDSPDVYEYSIIGDSTVRLENVQRDKSKTCSEEYGFVMRKPNVPTSSSDQQNKINLIIAKLPTSIAFIKVWKREEFLRISKEAAESFTAKMKKQYNCPASEWKNLALAFEIRKNRSIYAEKQAFDNYVSKTRAHLKNLSNDNLTALANKVDMESSKDLAKLIPNDGVRANDYFADKNRNLQGAQNQLLSYISNFQTTCSKK